MRADAGRGGRDARQPPRTPWSSPRLPQASPISSNECGALGAGGVVVYAAGFAEAPGEEQGPVLQAALVAAAVRHDLPVIGPNGNGVVAVHSRAPLWGDAVTLRIAWRHRPHHPERQRGRQCAVPHHGTALPHGRVRRQPGRRRRRRPARPPGRHRRRTRRRALPGVRRRRPAAGHGARPAASTRGSAWSSSRAAAPRPGARPEPPTPRPSPVTHASSARSCARPVPCSSTTSPSCSASPRPSTGPQPYAVPARPRSPSSPAPAATAPWRATWRATSGCRSRR